jgi:hypothetical protein
MQRLRPTVPVGRRDGLLTAVLLSALLATVRGADAGKLILRIRTGNPIEKTQKAQIRANLPARISTNNIISQGGLDLGYDVDSGTYYVHKEVDLGPSEIAVYDVELEDIWVMADDELAALRARSRELIDKLKSTSHLEVAQGLQREVERHLDELIAVQQRSSISAGATPIDHIRAYEANLEILGRIRKDVGRLENLVLGTGRDPGPLLGAAEMPAPKRPVELKPEEYKTAVFQITVRNPSPTQPRTDVSIHQELPAEVSVQDILDAGGLEVGRDSRTGNVYVYRDNLEIPAGETVTFQVKIRDQWNVNGPRIAALQAEAGELLKRVSQAGQFASVEALLQQQLAELDALAGAPGPTALSAAYVAFYRGQGRRLDEIEARIFRIQSVLRPAEKVRQWGFFTKAPTMRTTWLIIYAILGFLAVLTLLFSLRWMGRTKAEKISGSPGSP